MENRANLRMNLFEVSGDSKAVRSILFYFLTMNSRLNPLETVKLSEVSCFTSWQWTPVWILSRAVRSVLFYFLTIAPVWIL